MNPDEPPKPSRSEWLFDAVCGLVRAGVPDAVILSMLMDPDLADEITHHLLGAARKGNIVAAIFLSKTRLGWRETGPSQDGGAKVAVQINMPGAMSEAMYLEGQADDED